MYVETALTVPARSRQQPGDAETRMLYFTGCIEYTVIP